MAEGQNSHVGLLTGKADKAGWHGTVIEADREGQADIKGSLLDSHEIFYARAAGEVPRGLAF